MALKVYRTPIGFHDAFVAAPSQKAALAAWGSDADLFARKVADVVTDPALTKEPLAHPGQVIKRLRGTVAEQLAAAPTPTKKPVKRAAREPCPSAPKGKPAKSRPAVPRPDRAAVDAAAAALSAAEDRHRAADRELAAAEKALADRRQRLRADWSAEREALERAKDDAEQRYAVALRRWQAAQA